jgi:hypothetical protein
VLHAAAGDVGGVQFLNYVYAVLMAQYLPMSYAAVALVSGSAGGGALLWQRNVSFAVVCWRRCPDGASSDSAACNQSAASAACA